MSDTITLFSADEARMKRAEEKRARRRARNLRRREEPSVTPEQHQKEI